VRKSAPVPPVVHSMATAVSTPAVAIGASVGVSVPGSFPEDEIRTVLADAGHRVGFWHETTAEAIDACRESQPELFLLGARQPDAALLQGVRALVDGCGETKVILICERSGDGDLRKALDAGVRGFVSLGEVQGALPPVVDVVRAGQISVPGPNSRELRKQVLTPREKQILGLVVMGMTNAEIAGKLYLAESTIKSHLSSAFAKLGVSSRSEAASVILDPKSAAGLGILTIPTG
jgi:DNA-binding NarL/FixJ family response regulator